MRRSQATGVLFSISDQDQLWSLRPPFPAQTTELVDAGGKTHLTARDRFGLLLRSGCFFVCQSMLTSHLTGPLSLAIEVQLAEIQPVCANERLQCCMRDLSAQSWFSC